MTEQSFTRVGDRLIPGRAPCVRCGGTTLQMDFPYTLPCPKCKGTGKRGNGRCHTCNAPYGYKNIPGRRVDYDRPVQSPCQQCGATGTKPATSTDYLPREIVEALPVRVLRAEQAMTWNQQWVAIGYLWTTTDYGEAWRQSERAMDDFVASVTGKIARDSTQACKVATFDRPTGEGRLCDAILVTVMPGGYTVRAVFETAQGRG